MTSMHACRTLSGYIEQKRDISSEYLCSPMISPRCSVFHVHSLLNHSPFPMFSYKEGVMIEGVTRLQGLVILCVVSGLSFCSPPV